MFRNQTFQTVLIFLYAGAILGALFGPLIPDEGWFVILKLAAWKAQWAGGALALLCTFWGGVWCVGAWGHQRHGIRINTYPGILLVITMLITLVGLGVMIVIQSDHLLFPYVLFGTLGLMFMLMTSAFFISGTQFT